MIAPLKQPRPTFSRTVRRNRFLELLPQIEYYACCAFRKMDRERREDAIQEVRANAWCAYHRLVELGKEDLAYASVLARFAVAQYRDGRRVGKKVNSKDVYSRQAQQKGAFRVHHFGSPRRQGCSWEDGLTDNTRSPVPDQAAFRIDFPAWLSTQSRRNRQIVQSLVVGNTCRQYLDIGDLSARSGLSTSTIHRLKIQGRIPFYQPGGKGGKLLFPPDAIDKCGQAMPASEPLAAEASTNRNGHLSGPRPAWLRTPDS